MTSSCDIIPENDAWPHVPPGVPILFIRVIVLRAMATFDEEVKAQGSARRILADC